FGSNLAHYEEDTLSQQLQIVARLIAGGLQTPLYMVRLGGFDTHDNQVDTSDHTQGEHATLLKSLDDGIMSFMNDLERHAVADRVVGMTFSEFGRRIVSNASLGTDHGSAAPLFVFGNAVKGGVLGQNPVFNSNATYSDNLAMQHDFRQVYASMLSQWFEQDASSIEKTLIKGFDQLPIIGEPVITAGNTLFSTTQLSVYPNPVGDQVVINYHSNGSNVRIDLYALNGQLVERIYRGPSKFGDNQLTWQSSHLGQGQYVIHLTGENLSESFKVIK
ncbi:MAG: DUF1501 domain-containing protein, partial [Pseudomonadota bacterium]